MKDEPQALETGTAHQCLHSTTLCHMQLLSVTSISVHIHAVLHLKNVQQTVTNKTQQIQ